MGVLADIKSTVDEYKGISSSLAAKGKNIAEYSQSSAPKPAPAAATPAPKDTGKRYGDRPGEKRLDSQGNVIPKYHTGIDYVPKTGPAILQKGERVISKEKNYMDAKTAMEGITGKKDKPAKKIKEIRTRVSDNGKLVHTHLHHHPEHHPDEMHVSDDAAGMAQHMTDQAPNMSAQPPEMADAGGAPPAAAPGM